MVVLPEPGGPHRMTEEMRPCGDHAGQRALGADQMLLPHDLAQALGPQPVGEGTRCPLLHAGGFEQCGHVCVLMLGNVNSCSIDALMRRQPDGTASRCPDVSGHICHSFTARC